ncbi:MAG: response regulator transcription factor [Saprospiraceae bacterium]|nr:response regulator transcription factor [Saprospiraceae bacterium]
MTLNCIIVDDDLMARKALERLCGKNPNIKIVGVFENGKIALDYLAVNEEPDLIFLDVEMPELTGIDLIKYLPDLPMVIFTTSKTEYAFDAFQFQALDYLQKPITLPRFEQAVQKAIDQFNKKNTSTATDFSSTTHEIYVKEDGRLIRVACDDILFFENVGDYVRVKTNKGQHIIHGTLKGVDERLNDARFLKVHRSFIVNLSKIKDIEENSLVIEKQVIPISRANKSELMGRLKIL